MKKLPLVNKARRVSQPCLLLFHIHLALVLRISLMPSKRSALSSIGHRKEHVTNEDSTAQVRSTPQGEPHVADVNDTMPSSFCLALILPVFAVRPG